MQTKDKKPFSIILRFIDFVKQTHRSESTRLFNDAELVVISHLEQAATDLRQANIKVIQRAKKIIAQSSFVPETAECRRFLLAAIELLLIEARARQRNPTLYDFLYRDTLWFYHNRNELPNEIAKEINDYLAYGSPYQSPEEAQKADETFAEIVQYHSQKPLNVEEFICMKIEQIPRHEYNDFIASRNVKDWIAKWHAEYVETYAYVSLRSFQNRISEIKRRLKAEPNGR